MYNVNDITVLADVTAEDLNSAVTKLKEENNLNHLGKYFLEAQKTYNVNAIILLAIACLESAYGTSKLALQKNNLFGIKADDELRGTDKYGNYFATKEDCIDRAAQKLRTQYLELDSKAPWCYCNGAKDLATIGSVWCSNPNWDKMVADICRRLTEGIQEGREQEIDYKELYFSVLKEKEELEKKIDKALNILDVEGDI